MKLTDIQYGDKYYITVDGVERVFYCQWEEGEDPPHEVTCDICGKGIEFVIINNEQVCTRDIFATEDGDIALCGECITKAEGH